MSGTYANVDGSAEPGQAVLAQETVDSWPQIRAYKGHSYKLLAAYAPVLDIGCGPGLDLPELAAGASVGLDASRAMCAVAGRRGTVVNANAMSLPFDDGTFGGVRADRVFQHLEKPDAALAELARVCRPGGKVVLADPDQETLSITVPGIPQEMSDRVKRLRRDIGYRNGRLVATLPTALADLGLTDVTVDAFPLMLRRADEAFGLPGWPRLWKEEGGFSDDEIDAWERATAEQPVAYSLLYFVVTGTKP
ncbi:MAG TPA: methyltransferase domain-containing protein [Acidimicrobiales bacterium]|jgi:SAM-dependent methyltransferase|nr:methyltransferase domain-containing protein [Acidimicrobiales bacterium]